ncbi:MAG TPA: GDSL-type esterase/lipase family protein [Bryobacteraceae bacterium]|nr:GDSL-type esterase/lipase family protein [Bryobacteraceae bacterium]
MKALILLLVAWALPAQTTAPAGSAGQGQKDVEQLATRMLQLMESTAVAIPGLTHASEALKQNAETTFTAMRHTPQNAGVLYQFMNQIRAYLALFDSMPRPDPFPAAVDQQYAELREGLRRLQLNFEGILQQQNQAEQKRDSDPNSLKRYAEADSKVQPPGKLPRVVFLGDSIMDAWRLNEYFIGRDFINRGIAGQTTLQMLARFRQDVVSVNPKAVVILGGTNDIAAGVSANQIEDNLTTIGDLAKAHGIRAVFASILPVSNYHKDADPRSDMTAYRPVAVIQSINAWLKNYCQSQGLVYMDYYSSMVDSAGQLQADLSDDGLNPNSKGYRVMSPIALEAIGRALGDAEDNQPSKRRFRLLSK